VTSPELLFTGNGFGTAGRAVGPVLHELIEGARQELHLLAYSLRASAPDLAPLLTAAVLRGVSITVIVDRLAEQPQAVREWLREMAASHAHVTIVSFEEPDASLHAKVLVADRRRAVVGSANFTWSGMVTNHEVAVLLKGEPARTLALAVDRLAASRAAGI